MIKLCETVFPLNVYIYVCQPTQKVENCTVGATMGIVSWEMEAQTRVGMDFQEFLRKFLFSE